MKQALWWVAGGLVLAVGGLVFWVISLRRSVADAAARAKLANAEAEVTKALDPTALNKSFDAAKTAEGNADAGLAELARDTTTADAAAKREGAANVDRDLASRGYK